MTKKETTIDELAEKVDGLANTVDDLARITATGFHEVKEEIGQVKHEMIQLREQNEREHLELKLRQDQVPYRFEVQDLERRVTRLEKKTSL